MRVYQSPYRGNGNGNPQNYRAQMAAQQQKQLQLLELITKLPALTRANQPVTGNTALSASAGGLSQLFSTSTTSDIAAVVNSLKGIVQQGLANDGGVYAAERQNFVLKLLLGGGLGGGGGINDLLTLSLLSGSTGGGIGGLI